MTYCREALLVKRSSFRPPCASRFTDDERRGLGRMGY